MSSLATPNTRVQRTRSSPSALREPLTRHPLGDAGRRKRRLAIAALALAWFIGPGVAFAGGHKAKPTGFFSNMHYVEEAGDVVGMEVFITYSTGHYWAYVQIAEGVPSPPVLVEAMVNGDRVEFTLPESSGMRKFVGKATAKALVGKFDGDVGTVRLPRRNSYWK